jgi:uncharacterized protein
MKEPFEFEGEGETLVGTLFLPVKKAVGVVVASGPLTSVKEQAAGAYAKAMAERGFAALAFDHRYLGESGGQPRQLENPLARIEDIKNAATALVSDERFEIAPSSASGSVSARVPWCVPCQRMHGSAQWRALQGSIQTVTGLGRH